MNPHGRTLTPPEGDETTMLLAFLDWQRETFEWKCEGVGAEGLAATVGASTMTLGGLLKHLASVEYFWFPRTFADAPHEEPWRSADWDADPDWAWRTAADHSPEELFALWRGEVERSRAIVRDALATEAGLDTVAANDPASLRWILFHMIEEYARHVGHADLLRESVDGATGE
jgi:uncharacterized damage-inducible protein DinB